MRLFIAAVIPNFALKKIIEVQDTLRFELGKSIRWTNPASIHLTLKFMGEVSESKKAAIWKEIETICIDGTNYSIDCSKIGVFPNVRSPKIVWLGLKIPEELSILQKEMNNRLVSFGIDKEEREFSPHLTLGRVNSSLTNSEMSFLQEKIAGYSNGIITSFEIDRICLIKSDLLPTGPQYTTLNSIILKAVE